MPDGVSISRNGLAGIGRVLRDLGGERGVPFAGVVAATRAAQQARTDLQAAMPAAFDRPTRWTLNSLFVEPATKAKPSAAVFFKDNAPNGVPAGRYLRAQILGAPRVLKSWERRIGLPAGYITVPGKWADLDGHGNISSGQMKALLADLDLYRSTVRRAQTRKRGVRRQESYFVVRTAEDDAERGSYGMAATRTADRAHLPPGIYKQSPAMGGAPLLVVAFVRQYPGSYRVRFDFAAIGGASIERNLPRLLEEAVADRFTRVRTTR